MKSRIPPMLHIHSESRKNDLPQFITQQLSKMEDPGFKTVILLVMLSFLIFQKRALLMCWWRHFMFNMMFLSLQERHADSLIQNQHYQVCKPITVSCLFVHCVSSSVHVCATHSLGYHQGLTWTFLLNSHCS